MEARCRDSSFDHDSKTPVMESHTWIHVGTNELMCSFIFYHLGERHWNAPPMSGARHTYFVWSHHEHLSDQCSRLYWIDPWWESLSVYLPWCTGHSLSLWGHVGQATRRRKRACQGSYTAPCSLTFCCCSLPIMCHCVLYNATRWKYGEFTGCGRMLESLSLLQSPAYLNLKAFG